MADTPIQLPQLGETVTEGTILKWLKSVGESVALEEPLYEISTDKVDTEVPSPVAGVLKEIRVQEGDVAEVGTVLGVVDSAGGDASSDSPGDISDDASGDASGGAPAALDESTVLTEEAVPTETPEPAAEADPDSAPDSDSEPAPDTTLEPATEPAAEADLEPTSEADPDSAPDSDPEPAPKSAPQPTPAPTPQAAPKPTDSSIKKITSPLVRRLIRSTGIDVSIIVPTGPGGRITRKDVERAVSTTAGAATSSSGGVTRQQSDPTIPSPSFRKVPPTKTAVPLSKIRKLTGEHMNRSKATSAHVLTAVEVDFENLERVRQSYKPIFKADEGFSLTYLPFIVRAVCDSLAKYPHLNASIVEDELVVPNYVNMGIAVDLDFDGLLAPVIRDADSKPLREIAHEIVDLAKRSRAKKLKPNELEGGTFTITNPGQYGTLMQFPIINQPQVAILSTDGVRRKPVVLVSENGEESIAIHSVGVLALAWDHRAFDGAYVAAFLDYLRKIIQGRDWEIEL